MRCSASARSRRRCRSSRDERDRLLPLRLAGARASARPAPRAGRPCTGPPAERRAGPTPSEDDEARLGEVPSRRPGPRGRAIAIAGRAGARDRGLDRAVRRRAVRPRRRSRRAGGRRARRARLPADDGRGGSTLWIVDLLAGHRTSRPVGARPDRRAVDLSGAAPGWIGVERRTRDRTVAAVVRGIVADADVDRLGSGDLVAWGPGGRSLVFARNGRPAATGARRSASAW